MTRDEILDEYEALWRQAMVDAQPQFHYPPPAKRMEELCAVLISYKVGDRFSELRNALDAAPAKWTCPLDGCDSYYQTLGSALRHLNDWHHWTWDMFANKFRDALTQGEAGSSHAPASAERRATTPPTALARFALNLGEEQP